MKKRKPKKNKPKLKHKILAPRQASIIPKTLPKLGAEGIFARAYPPKEVRVNEVERLNKISAIELSSNELWKLGEYQIYDGLLDEDEMLINKGIDSLTKGASHISPSPACMLDLGWILLHRGLPALALGYLNQANKLVPGSRDVLSLLGHTHIKLGNQNEALEIFMEIERHNLSNDADKKILDELVAGRPCLEISRQLGLLKFSPSDLLHMNERPREINKAFKFFIKENLKLAPDDIEIRRSLASIHYFLNEYNEAKKILDMTVNRHPSADDFVMLALIEFKNSKDTIAAEQYYRNALALDYKHKLALVNLASLLQDKGKFKEARPLLEAAVRLDTDSPYHAISLDLYATNVSYIEGNYHKEAELHLRALSLDPKNSKFIANCIFSLLSAGKIIDARKLFTSNRTLLRNLQNFNLLETIVKAFTSDEKNPMFFLKVAEEIQALMGGWRAVQPLLRNSYKLRDRLDTSDLQVTNDEDILKIRCGFLQELGTLCGQAGDFERSILIWEELGEKYNQPWAYLNKAVDLERSGQPLQALAYLDNIQPFDGGRYYTVKGNILNGAGQTYNALKAYQLAIMHDESFILPIQNGVTSCAQLGEPTELKNFIKALKEHWMDTKEGKLCFADCLRIQGRFEEASVMYEQVLTSDGEYIEPDELIAQTQQDDITLFQASDIEGYKHYALSLLKSRNWQKLQKLHRYLEMQKEWYDGDLRIILAESYRLSEDIENCLHNCEKLGSQPSADVTRALCAIQNNDLRQAELLAKENLVETLRAEQYTHPEGNPKAIFEAIIAQCIFARGDIEEASSWANRSVLSDNVSAYTRSTLSKILYAKRLPDQAIIALQDGLRRNPGNFTLISMLIELLLENGEHDEAHNIINHGRDVCVQQSESGHIEGLIELILLQKLNNNDKTREIELRKYPWATHLHEKSQNWLACYFQIKLNDFKLSESAFLYLAKILENELGEKIFQPFKEKCGDPSDLVHPQFKDLSRFLEGDYAPSLGAMHRVLKACAKSDNNQGIGLIDQMGNFLETLSHVNKNILYKRATLDRLNSLAHLRNAVAHTGLVNHEKCEKAGAFIVNCERPGSLLEMLGIKI